MKNKKINNNKMSRKISRRKTTKRGSKKSSKKKAKNTSKVKSENKTIFRSVNISPSPELIKKGITGGKDNIPDGYQLSVNPKLFMLYFEDAFIEHFTPQDKDKDKGH